MNGEWSQVVVHMARQAGAEAHDAALARTGDRVHALSASYRASRDTSTRLLKWARERHAGKVATAAGAFFAQNPGLRPRTDAEAKEMAAQAEADYVERNTEIAPEKYVERIVNGERIIEPMRKWFISA